MVSFSGATGSAGFASAVGPLLYRPRGGAITRGRLANCCRGSRKCLTRLRSAVSPS